MPHCTTNFAWYLGKFIAGFTGMLFLYFGFLKELEYRCLCRARMREFMRRKGEKKPGRCECEKGVDYLLRIIKNELNRNYFCTEGGTRSMLAGVENLYTQYTRIQEWFLENDPPLISETAFAFDKDLPKNDNGNFDFSSESLCIVDKLYVPFNATRSEDEDSSTSVRNKRSCRHCLFRHCSGIACPQKFTRGRRKKRCLRLRVSQDVVSDYWKGGDKLKSDVNNANDFMMYKECENARSERIKVLHEPEQNYAPDTSSDENDGKRNSIEYMEKPVSELYSENVDLRSKTLLESSRVCDEIACFDRKLLSSSSKLSEAKRNEKQLFNVETDQVETFPRSTEKWNISDKTVDNNRKVSPKRVNEGTSQMQQESGWCRIDKIKTSLKKQSKSDTRLNDTIITKNCIDSILFRDLYKKRMPLVKGKSSKDIQSDIENANNMNSCRESNIDKNTENIFNNISSFTSRQKRKCSSKHSVNRQHPSKCKNLYAVTTCQNGTTKRKLPKFFSQHCSCHAKARDTNSPQWNDSKMFFTNFQYHRPCEHGKLKKSSRSIAETYPSRYSAQPIQYKEKPTLTIFKNQKSNKRRTLEQTKFDNHTNSSYSSSTISTDITDHSFQDHSVACWHPRCKLSHCALTTNRRKYNSKRDTTTDLNRLPSSSSCLSSSKRLHSWAMLSKNSIYHEQEPISSSTCANVKKWRKQYSENTKRTSAYHSSTSSSCSFTSLSTYWDNYNVQGSNDDQIMCNTSNNDDRIFRNKADSIKNLKQVQRLRGRPKCRKHERRIVHMNERYIAWNIKNTY